MLFSLLTIANAPTYHLWLIAILVTEFPLFFALASGVTVAWGLKMKKHQLGGTLAAMLALILFLTPVARAWMLSKKLASDMAEAFPGKTANSSAPFKFSALVGGKSTALMAAQIRSYFSLPDIDLKMDFYLSPKPGKRPCVLVIHGGSWKSGDNKQLPELNSVLAYEGYQVAAINYRLAPKYQSPFPVDDVKAAVKYLKQHADELNIDSSKLVLLGRSAGAQIALLAAYTLKDPSIKGVIDFYGPADMVWGYSAPANPLVMDSRRVMEDYLGGKYAAVPKNYFASSPIEFVSKNSPPTLIIHGQNDVLVAHEHSIRLQNKLNKFKVKNYFLSMPWATHGFDYNINGPGGQLSTYAVKEFLKGIL